MAVLFEDRRSPKIVFGADDDDRYTADDSKVRDRRKILRRPIFLLAAAS